MTEFTEILKNALAGVNAAYDQAFDDLREVTQKAKEAIQETAGEEIVLQLVEGRKDVAGTTFSLQLTRGNARQAVGAYRLHANGYPIGYGRLKGGFIFEPDGAIQTRADLEAHFRELLSNRDSALVTTIAFLLR